MGKQREPAPGEEPANDGRRRPEPSASYLSVDDERLWITMPTGGGDDRKRKQSRPPAAKRRGRGRRVLISLTILAALGGAGAYGAMVLLEDTPELPVATSTPTMTTSPSPSPIVLEIEGLQATKVSKKTGVHLTWNAASAGSFEYVVTRDGVELGRTDTTEFIDATAEPGSYYYYAVSGMDATGAQASAPPLLVQVFVEDSFTATPTMSSAPPPVYYTPPAPSPSPTRTSAPSPTPTKTSTSPKPSPSPTGPTFCEIYPTSSLCS